MEKGTMNEKEFEYDEGTLARLKKFIRDYDSVCKKDVERMRKDRSFAAGDQWNEYENDANSGRPETVFNIIGRD